MDTNKFGVSPEFTVNELSKLANALREYIFSLIEEGRYDDDSVLFAINDYINLYEKIACYRDDSEEV